MDYVAKTCSSQSAVSDRERSGCHKNKLTSNSLKFWSKDITVSICPLETNDFLLPLRQIFSYPPQTRTGRGGGVGGGLFVVTKIWWPHYLDLVNIWNLYSPDARSVPTQTQSSHLCLHAIQTVGWDTDLRVLLQPRVMMTLNWTLSVNDTLWLVILTAAFPKTFCCWMTVIMLLTCVHRHKVGDLDLCYFSVCVWVHMIRAGAHPGSDSTL